MGELIIQTLFYHEKIFFLSWKKNVDVKKSLTSVTNNFISIKTLYAHLYYANKKVYKVSKRSIENRGRSWLHKRYTIYNIKRDGQTDGQTGANLNVPLTDYRHKGIKSRFAAIQATCKILLETKWTLEAHNTSTAWIGQ